MQPALINNRMRAGVLVRLGKLVSALEKEDKKMSASAETLPPASLASTASPSSTASTATKSWGAPNAKVSAGVLGAAASTLILAFWHPQNPETAVALTTVLTFVIQYLVKERE